MKVTIPFGEVIARVPPPEMGGNRSRDGSSGMLLELVASRIVSSFINVNTLHPCSPAFLIRENKKVFSVHLG